MKRFVYMDTDTINSYLSQIDDGLLEASKNLFIKNNSESKSESETETNHTNSIQLGIPAVASLGMSAGGNSSETVRSIYNSQVGGDILTKKLHDNAYSLLYNHLNSQKPIKTDIANAEIGDYVLVKSNFYVVDLEYFIKENFMDIFMKVYPRLINPESTNPNINKSKLKKEFSDIEHSLNLLKIISHVLPSNKFILSNGFFIPLEDKFFRENINSIKFKYPGESYIFAEKTGTIGNILHDQKNLPGSGEVLTTLTDAFDSFNLSIFNLVGINNGDSVLNPISWYYEWN